VTGLGSPSYDVMAAGDHDNNYYLWAAMGSAAMVGLGLATARQYHSVLVVTGDGETLMGFGALATIALRKPANLTIAILDNPARVLPPRDGVYVKNRFRAALGHMPI
jgi:thiamine pyrophosphate-dependent acetolactate synthase large subunit-like protein